MPWHQPTNDGSSWSGRGPHRHGSGHSGTGSGHEDGAVPKPEPLLYGPDERPVAYRRPEPRRPAGFRR